VALVVYGARVTVDADGVELAGTGTGTARHRHHPAPALPDGAARPEQAAYAFARELG
jgi:hypothetical protein